MKALPSRPLFRSCPRLLCSLCVVTALVLAFPAPSAQAADLKIYGGGGGGGSSGPADGDGGAGGMAGAGLGGSGGTGGAASGGSGGGGGGGGAGGPGSNGSPGNAGGAGGSGGGADALYGGAGGAGGTGGGVGGNGAPATASLDGSPYSNVAVAGGHGGNGGDGGAGRSVGAGGAGGAASLTLNGNNLSLDTLNIWGGDSGEMGGRTSSGDGGDGGDGGAASLTLGGDNLSVNTLDIRGGHSGGGRSGGDAEVTARNLTVKTFSMSSGDIGTSREGGDISFTADTLKTGNITLNTYRSNLDFKLTKLVWAGDGTFTVTKDEFDTPNIHINSLTIDGGTVNSANYSNLISADSFYTDKTITLGDNGATFNTAGGDQTVGRKLIGTGGLTKEGAGTLALTGSNTYGGGTTIKAGTLKGNIAANTDLSIAAGAKYDGAGKARSLSALNGEGKVLNTNGLIVQSGTFGGVIDNSNTGGLTKDGAGTLELTGTNTYTGDTTIKAGTLALSGGGTLGASSLLDLRGGALDISGIAPASLSLPDMDVRGPARLDIGDRTADFSGKTLSFYVPSDMGAGGTLLSVGGAGITDIGNSTVRVGIAGSSSPLGAGDAVTLIDAPDGTLQGDPANTGSKGEGMQGVTLRYAFDVARIGNRLTATVAGSPQVDPRSKALAEGFVGGLSLSLQGADLAAGRGMESAVRASSATARAGTSAFAGFGALSGGMLRSNTGSHVDMNSLSLLTGLAWGVDLAPGRLTLGAFFEYGNGSYDTYNSFGNAASVRGEGDTRYLGGGVLARMNFAPAETLGGPGHFYAEASGRAGRTRNEYDSSDLRDAAGRKAEYDSASPYYGLHVGAGYVWSISENVGLDLYGKYFWTRQKGDGVRLSTGENLRFKDADSSRLRLGGRLACTVNQHVAPYVGAAWEREFDGKARATSNGFDLDAPSLRGDTGVGELGLSLTPSADLPLSVDLGVQGYTGKREGVTGSLMVKFEF